VTETKLTDSLQLDIDDEIRDLTVLDILTVSSSAWTFVGGYLDTTLVPPTHWGVGFTDGFEVFDAGIKCNMPLDPSWLTNNEAIFLFDFSISRTRSATLVISLGASSSGKHHLSSSGTASSIT
jgi:hypothetical protein